MNYMLPHTRYSRRQGFTLIELLTVIAIIAILAAILIPVLGKVRHGANSTKSTSNLRQIGSAVMLYTNQNAGFFPLLNRKAVNGQTPTNGAKFYWMQSLEEDVLEWDRAESGGVKHPMFIDPTVDVGHGLSDYGGSTYIFLDGNDNNPSRAERAFNIINLEEPAKTLVVCTAYAKDTGNASWYVQGGFAKGSEPVNIPEARLNEAEVGVLFADGHVELLSREKVYDLEFRIKLFDPTVF